MPEPGEETILLDRAVGLADTVPAGGEDIVLYSGELGRGDSAPEVGDDVVDVTEDVGQGPAVGIGGVQLERLKADKTALYKGETTTLSIKAVNNNDEQVDFPVDFKEDGTVIDSQTKTIPSRGEATYSTTITKSTAGEFTYQANGSNELKISWLNVRPIVPSGEDGPFVADPQVMYVDRSSTNTTSFSLELENPGSSGIEVQVRFLEDTFTEVGSEQTTIEAGTTHTFTGSQTYDSEQDHTYVAQIVEVNNGISGKTNNQACSWITEDTQFEQVKISADWVDTGSTPISGTIEAGGGGDPPDRHEVQEPYGEDRSITITIEDSNDYDFYDCFITYDQINWEDAGYLTITLKHLESAAHEWDIGPAPYTVREPDGTESGTITFQGRFYKDGVVTDLDGNELGNWK